MNAEEERQDPELGKHELNRDEKDKLERGNEKKPKVIRTKRQMRDYRLELECWDILIAEGQI